MVQLKGEYIASQILTDGDGRRLTVFKLNELPEWSSVEIGDIDERETEAEANRRHYLSIVFNDVGEDGWYHRQMYFNKSDLKPLLELFAIDRLEDTDQLVGKRLLLKFCREPGRGKYVGKEFVSIEDYRLTEDDGSGDDLPF